MIFRIRPLFFQSALLSVSASSNRHAGFRPHGPVPPAWRKLYNHSTASVKNHGMQPTFEHDFGKVWLDA